MKKNISVRTFVLASVVILVACGSICTYWLKDTPGYQLWSLYDWQTYKSPLSTYVCGGDVFGRQTWWFFASQSEVEPVLKKMYCQNLDKAETKDHLSYFRDLLYSDAEIKYVGELIEPTRNQEYLEKNPWLIGWANTVEKYLAKNDTQRLQGWWHYVPPIIVLGFVWSAYTDCQEEICSAMLDGNKYIVHWRFKPFVLEGQKCYCPQCPHCNPKLKI